MGTIILLIVVAAISAAVAVGATKMYGRKFGLKEARAAAAYVGDSEVASRAVLGVVIGVLEYTSTVADDVAKLAADLAVSNEADEERIDSNDREIAVLKLSSDRLQAEIADRDADMLAARKVADLFGG